MSRSSTTPTTSGPPPGPRRCSAAATTPGTPDPAAGRTAAGTWTSVHVPGRTGPAAQLHYSWRILLDTARHPASCRAGVIAAHNAGTDLVLASVLLREKDCTGRRATSSGEHGSTPPVPLRSSRRQQRLSRTLTKWHPRDCACPCSPCSAGCGATSCQRHAPWLPVNVLQPGNRSGACGHRDPPCSTVRDRIITR
jgi:hypothetical protein